MASRILTPANQITILRLAFIPFFAILVVDQRYRGALAVLTAAALSDVVDGTVARLLKQETPLGVALDPIADKLLMTTAYLTLAFREALPWWLTIMVISRDAGIIITALLISLVAGYRPFSPDHFGEGIDGRPGVDRVCGGELSGPCALCLRGPGSNLASTLPPR